MKKTTMGRAEVDAIFKDAGLHITEYFLRKAVKWFNHQTEPTLESYLKEYPKAASMVNPDKGYYKGRVKLEEYLEEKRKAVRVVNSKTGKVMLFPSIYQTAKALKVDASRVSQALSRPTMIKNYNLYYDGTEKNND